MEPAHIGMCYVYPDNLRQTCGTLNYPITNMKFQPIGKITSKNCLTVPVCQCASVPGYVHDYLSIVGYLVTHPTPGLEMDFSSSCRNYWSGNLALSHHDLITS